MTTEELEVARELATLDHIVDTCANDWVDGDEFPTLGEWIDHYVDAHLTRDGLRLIASHYLIHEVSDLFEDADPEDQNGDGDEVIVAGVLPFAQVAGRSEAVFSLATGAWVSG